jgi:hypothetical protein
MKSPVNPLGRSRYLGAGSTKSNMYQGRVGSSLIPGERLWRRFSRFSGLTPGGRRSAVDFLAGLAGKAMGLLDLLTGCFFLDPLPREPYDVSFLGMVVEVKSQDEN